jgi:hypothetical protein
VDLQGVAAVFDDVGIDKARHDALANEGFAQLLGKDSGGIGWDMPRIGRTRHASFPYGNSSFDDLPLRIPGEARHPAGSLAFGPNKKRPGRVYRAFPI